MSADASDEFTDGPTGRYLALTAQLDAAVTRREEATTAVRTAGPAAMIQLRSDLQQINARLATEIGRYAKAVLVVDDDTAVRRMYVECLKLGLGVPVFEAATVGDAIRVWQMERPGVVVVDLYLGGTESGDLFLMTLPRAVKAVMVSGIADSTLLRRASAISGAVARTKPVDTLLHDVRNALQAAFPL